MQACRQTMNTVGDEASSADAYMYIGLYTYVRAVCVYVHIQILCVHKRESAFVKATKSTLQ
jgi:hypothetical protein